MMTKILFITSTFPTKKSDKQNPWMIELIRRLKQRGIKIDVLAPAYKGRATHSYFGTKVFRFRYAPAFLETLTHEEGAVFKLRQKPWLTFLPMLYLVSGLIKTVRITRNSHYDVIHVHWPFPQGIFGLTAKWFTKAKLVFTFYGAEFALIRRVPLGTILIRFLTKKADQVLAISQHTKNEIQNLVPVKVDVIPFTCGFSQNFCRSTKKKATQKTTKKILFVGRLIERKGIPYLIKAIPLVLKSTNAQLDVVGKGMLLPKLKKLVEKMKLTHKVFIYGRVPEEKLIDFYQSCDVFVLPAIIDRWGDTEGLGVVLLEAMSFQKPVVASKVGGITDIVKDGQTGLLVPPKNSSALAKAIIKVLTNKKVSEKLAQEGCQYLQSHFNWEKIVAETIKIYS